MFLSCGDCTVYGHAKVGGCGGSELLAWRVVVLSSGCLGAPLALCLGLGLLLCAGTCIGLLVMTRSGVMRGRVVLVSLLRGFPVRSLHCCWRLTLLLLQRCGVVMVVAISCSVGCAVLSFGACVALLATDNLSHVGRRGGGDVRF